MVIAKSALQAYLNQELDSFQWMKKLTQQQILDQVNKFKVKPKFKTAPWTHQLICFYLGLCYPGFVFALDMGLGKTKILLDIATQLKREGKLERFLVLVPRLINLGTWEDAVTEHSDLRSQIISGSIDDKVRGLMDPHGEVVIVDYTGLQLALGMKVEKKKKRNEEDEESKAGRHYKADQKRISRMKGIYQMVALDESHKAKNIHTVRFDILDRLTKDIPYRYCTTGTLFGRDPVDLFGQFYLADQGETFGELVGMFKEAFYVPAKTRWNRHAVTFNKKMTHVLCRRIQHRSIRFSEDECLDLPPRRLSTITVGLTDEQREHYDRAVKGLVLAKGNLREQEAIFLRLRQIVAGFLEWKDEEGKGRVIFQDNPKLEALEYLIERLPSDQRMVISHEYRVSGELIAARLDRLGIEFEWLHGGSKDPINAVRRFLGNREKRVFLMQSEAGGTGTDKLQTVCRTLTFYELPVSPITWKQVIKRIHRPGQSHPVTIYDLSATKTCDFRIKNFLKEGKDLHEAVVDGDYHQILLD